MDLKAPGRENGDKNSAFLAERMDEPHGITFQGRAVNKSSTSPKYEGSINATGKRAR
jgi:hypothetical protein